MSKAVAMLVPIVKIVSLFAREELLITLIMKKTFSAMGSQRK